MLGETKHSTPVQEGYYPWKGLLLEENSCLSFVTGLIGCWLLLVHSVRSRPLLAVGVFLGGWVTASSQWAYSSVGEWQPARSGRVPQWVSDSPLTMGVSLRGWVTDSPLTMGMSLGGWVTANSQWACPSVGEWQPARSGRVPRRMSDSLLIMY